MRNTLRAAAFLAAAGLVLAGCGGNDTAAPPTTPPPTNGADNGNGDDTNGDDGELETTSLVVGAIPIADAAPLHYAVAEGMFTEVGLDVEIQPSAGGAAGIPALIAGERDLDIGNLISLVQALESGLELVSLPYILEHPRDAVVLASAADSPLQSVADLEGQRLTVAINTLGNLGEVLVRKAWEDAGLDWSDVTVAQIPFPEMVPAMNRGDVDLAWLPEPFLTIARGEGANVVLDTVGMEPPLEGRLISGPVLATRAFAEANPNTLRVFMEVMTRAGQELNANRDAAEAIIADYTGLPAPVVANLALPTYAPEPSLERVQAFLDMSAGYGVIPESNAADWFIIP